LRGLYPRPRIEEGGRQDGITTANGNDDLSYLSNLILDRKHQSPVNSVLRNHDSRVRHSTQPRQCAAKHYSCCCNTTLRTTGVNERRGVDQSTIVFNQNGFVSHMRDWADQLGGVRDRNDFVLVYGHRRCDGHVIKHHGGLSDFDLLGRHRVSVIAAATFSLITIPTGGGV